MFFTDYRLPITDYRLPITDYRILSLFTVYCSLFSVHRSLFIVHLTKGGILLMNISIIVAIAENFAIGRNNELLFHLPNDLKRFRQITTGHPVIMGRNTLLSLPKWPLPNRRNIVITDNPEDQFSGCEVVYSTEEAIELVKDESESFIIGGGSVYRQFFPVANRLYLTVVNKTFEADTFFPEIDYSAWNVISREDHFDEINGFSYTYLNLERKDSHYDHLAINMQSLRD